MSICANCGRSNVDDALICAYCDQIVGPDTDSFGLTAEELTLSANKSTQPRRSGSFGRRTRLIFYAVNANQMVEIDAHKPGGLIVGRCDAAAQVVVDVDLTPVRGLEAGVSRRHARLIVQNDHLRIVDLGSTNGTYINGLRLPPHEPVDLRDGDEVYLGRLKLMTTFMDGALWSGTSIQG